MKIYINEEVLDSKLEKEETLGEVYSEIRKWAEAQGKFLLQCLVDGKEMLLDELRTLSIEGRERLDFYVGENLDLLVNSLVELDKYLDNIGNTLLGRDSLTEKESKDLQDGIAWIHELLNSAKNLMKLDFSRITPVPGGNTLDTILSTTQEGISDLDSASGIERYLENLRDLKLFILNLINRTAVLTVDTKTLKDVLMNFSENMEVMKNEFIRVNENFQSGKDALAGELLSHSIGRLNIMLSSFISIRSKLTDVDIDTISIDGKTLGETIEQLNSLLDSVAKSLEIRDIVMAGDILEYELPDILDQFVPFLKEIIKFL
ncbi:MAG: hypothetical protein H7A24_12765 [Leptospiraceae bacterium]|nr:hypothetical protein [Leptospiraceae bacterium]MCP5512748.1 hypothetical protein [Leptospiraceae bacterium]